MREFKSLQPKRLRRVDVEPEGNQPRIDIIESKGKIQITYNFPGFYLVDENRTINQQVVNFKQVDLTSVGSLVESGKPELPSFGRYVQIPFGYDYRVTVRKANPVQFENIRVMPAQANLTDDAEQEQEDIFEFDQKFYKRNTLYPRKMVNVTGPVSMDGYCALLVHICPFQYNPARNLLTGYGQIQVTIRLFPKKGRRAAVPASADDHLAYGNLFLNPSRNIHVRLGLPVILGKTGSVASLPPLQSLDTEFLIIHEVGFSAAAQKLAKWKRTCGVKTQTFSIATIGNTAPQIKQFIRNWRGKQDAKLRYVLLLGDSDGITSETVTDTSTETYASDYYYSTETNATGSNYVFPWLSVGRIPVRTSDEALQVVDQIIDYEKTPPADSAYYKRIIFASAFSGTGTQDKRKFIFALEKDIYPVLAVLGFNIQRVYVCHSTNPQTFADGTPLSQDVINSFMTHEAATQALIDGTSEGQLFMVHRDHAGVSGWGHPHFTTDDLDKVTGNTPSMFYSLNCLSGKFNYSDTDESFAEKNLRMCGGAPSLIAATRVTSTTGNNLLIRGLFDATFGGVIPTFPTGVASYTMKNRHLGDILNYARFFLPIETTGENAGLRIRAHMQRYHVIGDPTLQVWAQAPLEVTLQATFMYNPLSLSIVLSHVPANNVLSVWVDGNLKKQLTPASTHVTVALGTLPDNKPVTIRVGLFAPGYRYVECELYKLPPPK
ncbi:Gingipain R1 [Thermoflexales bacterium]|nr:Gingipain R1 [Thermoflexales bacterium]